LVLLTRIVVQPSQGLFVQYAERELPFGALSRRYPHEPGSQWIGLERSDGCRECWRVIRLHEKPGITVRDNLRHPTGT
jgi:hypothetical protein